MNVCSESEKKIFLFFIFLSETIIKNPPNLAVLQVYLRHPLRQEVRFGKTVIKSKCT